MISMIKKINILLCLGLSAAMLSACQQQEISSILYPEGENTAYITQTHDHDADETEETSPEESAAPESLAPESSPAPSTSRHEYTAAPAPAETTVEATVADATREPETQCAHNYAAATCTSPQICTICGTANAPALSHSYKSATCTAPQTCTRCGAAKGSALGHSYKSATCTAPQTCTRCGEAKGSALGHSYADVNGKQICTRCSAVGGTTSDGNYTYNAAYCKEVLNLVNAERAKQGIAALTWSDSLGESATVRAKEIIVNFSHTRPDGTSCFTVNPLARGENIASGYASPQAVVTAWMNSSGHRANILNASYKTLGVGYVKSAKGGYTHYWTQLFG